MPRETADTIALIFAITVAIVVVSTTAGILYVEIVSPAQDTRLAVETIGRFVSVLVAALVGYMAGRRVNGKGR